MPVDHARLKHQVALGAVLAVGLAAVAGTYLFMLSLRPCRLAFAPGTLLDYRLVTEYAELGADGKPGDPRRHEQQVTLVCIGQDNEVALVHPAAGGRDEVTILRFAADGTARRYRDSQLADDGKALGFFDFNLLPLPVGNEQEWQVSLVYAALPPEKRQIIGRVKRRSSSSRPEFELRLPTVEWVNDERRYVQVRNLACTYRFDTSRGIIERALVQCDTGVEQTAGARRFRVKVLLELAAVGRSATEPLALRDLALATAEGAQALSRADRERLAPVLQRLSVSSIDHPGLRAVAARLAAQLDPATDAPPSRVAGPTGRAVQPTAPTRSANPVQPPSAPPGVGPAWWIQVASVAMDRREAADRMVAQLTAAGLPAAVHESGRWLAVRLGPYAAQDPAALTAAKRRYPAAGVRWLQR